MKPFLVLVIAITLWVTEAELFAQSSTGSGVKVLSPAEQGVARAQHLIEKNPKNANAFNALAYALSRRARETSDVRFYSEAEDALRRSFELAPHNIDGEKLQVWLLLGKHEFASAREAAQRLSTRMPNDVMIYGFLADANAELGNYSEAESAAQRMLDLRAGNIPGLTRAAYLRELFGDIDGALELMEMAYGSTPPSESEDRAWILSQMAHLKLSIGNTRDAETLLNQALTLYPGYHYALGNLAKARLLELRYDEAVDLLRQRYLAAPHTENLFELAEALHLAGKKVEADTAFAEFERKSLQESPRADNSNHELIRYYVDYANQPTKALEVARRELARRHDIYTLDCYAWALYANRDYSAARTQIEAALKVGVRDVNLFRHAREVALKSGDRRSAEFFRQQAEALRAPGAESPRVSATVHNPGRTRR